MKNIVEVKAKKLSKTQQEFIKGGVNFAWVDAGNGCEFEVENSQGFWSFTGGYRCWAIRPQEGFEHNRALFEKFSHSNGISYTEDIINNFFSAETTSNV